VQVPDLIAPFITRLEQLGVAYMISGSTAGILYGEPRTTHDVDTGRSPCATSSPSWRHSLSKNRRRLELDALTVNVAPVEYVIVRKLEYYREGSSQKHLRDIRAMLEMSAAVLDRAKLEQLIGERGLGHLWARVTAG
jgi:hypothetical protein